MKAKAVICRVNKSLLMNEKQKMKEMVVNNKIQVGREIEGCIVHLTFSDKNNPVIVKNILYILADVFEKGVSLNI